MKYDELEIDRQSGVIFQDLIHNSVCQKCMKNWLSFLKTDKSLAVRWTRKLNTLESVDLKVTDQTYINHLSGGMKQKLAIVETILQKLKHYF